MCNIKIYHKNWTDTIKIDYNKNILFRISKLNDNGKFILNDLFLIIYWTNWGKEYFYTKDKVEYYQITENNNLNISFIHLINDKYNDIFFFDINNLKIYSSIDMNYYKYNDINNNILKLEDDEKEYEYIYFNFKYYEINYLFQLFEIVYIEDFIYLLSKNNNLCYLDFNIFKQGTYYKYNNKIKINYNKSKKIYQYDTVLNKYINNFHCNEIIKTNENKIYIINDDNINELITYINYFNNFKVDCIIYDHINNKHNNDIYDFNIIYYNELSEIYNDSYIFKDEKEYIIDNNIYINEKSVIENWNEINIKNIDKYQYLTDYKKYDSIPKIIHFIWIGNEKIPDIYINYIESWIKNHSDYIFCFWNDENIPMLINQKYYDSANVYAMKADILRYELLYFFGGIYIDCDFLSIKNLDKIIENLDGFSGYESSEYIAIGIMGFKKYDNILFQLIKQLGYNIENNKNNNLKYTIPELTGPIFFTNIWLKYKNEKYYAFPPEYFYSYKFKDHFDDLKYKITTENYAIHMWGYSWNKNNKNIVEKDSVYYLLELYLTNRIDTLNYPINKVNYDQLTTILKNNIYYKPNLVKNKIRVVHIMGLFFTGGIERYLYYIDKFGDHTKYEYYLLYISNEKYVYPIVNMRMISFNWNHMHLNILLKNIVPHLIIDHYSLYLKDNFEIYKDINKNNIIYFVHSAITYKNNISNLNINNCIHLYEENNKEISWKNILNNHYLTLGTLLNIEYIRNIKNDINISIIGRIAEEKIPIVFFKKLCVLSNQLNNNIKINIYGEKDNIFNKEYVKQFEDVIKDSNIKFNDFISPLEMDKIYKNTDLLLIPSVFETGSFTCLEAFSYGIPVISRNVYGLKYLIKDSVTGYLCDNDEIILEKIKNIENDKIFENINIIKEESLKYNIVDKIKEFENIVNDYTNKKNIIIITSVLNCVNKPLSYYHTRSIFTVKERYKHTLKSIESVRKHMSHTEILFCECSELSDYEEYENDIKSKVDYYFNFNENQSTKNSVESELKGVGEANLLLEGIEKIMSLKKEYKNIFKLSGRYFLNNHFNIDLYNNNKNIFSKWDNSDKSYCTIFYKINFNQIYDFKCSILNSMENLNKKISIEECIYTYFKKDISIIEKLNISGFLATEGYLFTI